MSTNEAEPARDGDEAVPAAGSTPAAGAPSAADPDGGIPPEAQGSLAPELPPSELPPAESPPAEPPPDESLAGPGPTGRFDVWSRPTEPTAFASASDAPPASGTSAEAEASPGSDFWAPSAEPAESAAPPVADVSAGADASPGPDLWASSAEPPAPPAPPAPLAPPDPATPFAPAEPDDRFAPGGPAAPTVPVPAGAVVTPKRRRKLARAVTLGLLIVVGLAGVGGGGAALALEMTRHATRAEQAAALQTELASRWERLPAGKIFPATVGYVTFLGFNQTAQRVGIAPRATCTAALDPAAAGLLRRYGCVAVLRATYVDASGTLAGTIGIAVMSSASAANRAVAAASDIPANAGVRTFSLPGTLADQFTDTQRRVIFSIQSIGPYVFLYAGGYTDGRVSGSSVTTPALTDLGSGAILGVQNVLTYQGRACSMKDIKC